MKEESLNSWSESVRSDDKVLVFGSKNSVYAFDGKKVEKIAERSRCTRGLLNDIVTRLYEEVHALAFLNGEIFDGGTYQKIYNTLRNEPVAERPDSIFALAVCNNELYDAGAYQGIYKTMSNEKIFNTEYIPMAITCIDSNLYIADIAGRIIRIGIKEKVIDYREGMINTLIGNNRVLYDAGFYEHIYATDLTTLKTKPIARRKDPIMALVMLNGELHDVDWEGKLRRTKDGKVVYDFERGIRSMIVVPRYVLKGLI
jgi:hypothetical protein